MISNCTAPETLTPSHPTCWCHIVSFRVTSSYTYTSGTLQTWWDLPAKWPVHSLPGDFPSPHPRLPLKPCEGVTLAWWVSRLKRNQGADSSEKQTSQLGVRVGGEWQQVSVTGRAPGDKTKNTPGARCFTANETSGGYADLQSLLENNHTGDPQCSRLI